MLFEENAKSYLARSRVLKGPWVQPGH